MLGSKAYLDGANLGEREWLALTSGLAAVVSVCVVDLLVLGSVRGLHVPVESIFQAERVVLVLDALELFLVAA